MFLTAREVMCYALGLQSLCDPDRKFKGHPTVYTLTITNKKNDHTFLGSNRGSTMRYCPSKTKTKTCHHLWSKDGA